MNELIAIFHVYMDSSLPLFGWLKFFAYYFNMQIDIFAIMSRSAFRFFIDFNKVFRLEDLFNFTGFYVTSRKYNSFYVTYISTWTCYQNLLFDH